MNQHAAPPLDNGAGQGHQVGHGRLNGVADHDLSPLEQAEVGGTLHDTHLATGQTPCRRLPDQLAGGFTFASWLSCIGNGLGSRKGDGLCLGISQSVQD